MKAGIVLVNKYCDTNDSRYTGYINYIDRNDAVRNDNMEKYNLYQNYMDNPEKSTGIFTDTKDFLTYEEKQNIKEVIKKAQEKGSLMWQPVISFDNAWLEENGLYDHNTGLLDEVKIREFTRKSIGKMLHKENLDHAIWTASIHYNTDNIHIHVAIVEPVPMREKRSYTVYDYVPDINGNYVKSIYGSYVKATEKNQRYYAENKIKYKRIEKVDAKGNPVKREGYVGPFKQSSLELCKSTFANEILRDREYGIKINSLIRDSIVKRKRSMELEKDPELKERFLALHEKMPRKGNRGLWKYNSNIMLPLRTEIDQLTDLYIQKYHSEDFEALMGLIEKRSNQYKRAYGETDRNYKNKKIEDLHTRMGNAILEEIRKYDQSVAENLIQDEKVIINDSENNIDDKQDILSNLTKEMATDVRENIEIDLDKLSGIDGKKDSVSNDAYKKWFKQNKEIKQKVRANDKKAVAVTERYARNGNPLAICALAEIYEKGIGGKKIDLNAADEQYAYAHSIFERDYENVIKKNSKFDLKGYLAYRIGKQYIYGKGVEINSQKGIEWLKKADNIYSDFLLGNIFYFGIGEKKDMLLAREYYEKAGSFPLANLRLATMYENGTEIEKSEKKANMYYKKAYYGLLSMEDDHNMCYQLANLLYEGKGCDEDKARAKELYEIAAKFKNENAVYKLSQILIKEQNVEEYPRVEKMLKLLSDESDNEKAQYALGKFYLNEEIKMYNPEQAEYYLRKAAEKGNEYAQYTLGKYYLNVEMKSYSPELAEHYLRKATEKGNKYAQYTLGKYYLNVEMKSYNPELAEYYLNQSAEKGNEYAQLKLGIEYLKGTKIERNAEMGHIWLQKAANQDNEIAKKIITNMKNYETYCRRGKNVNGLAKEIRRTNMKNMQRLDKAVAALKRSMNQEYVRSSRQNQLEHDEMMEKNRYQ